MLCPLTKTKDYIAFPPETVRSGVRFLAYCSYARWSLHGSLLFLNEVIKSNIRAKRSKELDAGKSTGVPI
jgi:hypothetical protein